MANKRISAFVEKLALTASDFFAVDKASEADTKKIAASYFTDQFSDMQNILGAKNLLKNNLATQTVSGLTITAHSDGSFTVNGTSTANVNINLITNFILKAGEYILSGVGTDAPSNTVYITIAYSSTEAGCNKDNSQKHFTLANDTTITKVYFYCNSGVTFSNYKLYPMIRPASVVDSTFVPYAETNKQLTDDVTDINQALNTQGRELGCKEVAVGSSAVLNNLNNLGVGYCTAWYSSNKPTNAPFNTGSCYCIGGMDYYNNLHQIAIELTTGNIAIRSRNQGTWSSWSVLHNSSSTLEQDVATMSSAVSVPASSYLTGQEITIPTKAGYTPYFATLKSSGNVRCVVNLVDFDATNNKISVTILNTSAAAQSAQPSFYIYYKIN